MQLEFLLIGGGVLMLVVAMLMNRKPAPKAAASRSSAPKPAPPSVDDDGFVPSVVPDDDEDDADLTRLQIPSLIDDDKTVDEYDEEDEPDVLPILFDEEAALDNPTGSSAYILVSAVGQTDQGKRRKNNEDSFLLINDPPLYIVADGMGGYAGGEVASAMAVEEMARFFREDAADFQSPYPDVPKIGAEVVASIRSANKKIYDTAEADADLEGMGTTLVCARFSTNKQRVYVGHVGDSRCYRIRDNELQQVTTDHTVANEGGIPGPLGATLTRALGVNPGVTVDLIFGEPKAGDIYLLCSDGLTKMIGDEPIKSIVQEHEHDLDEAVAALIEAANLKGGKDNITVILVAVQPGLS